MKGKKKLLFLLLSVLVLLSVLFVGSVSESANDNSDCGNSLVVARKALEQRLLPLGGAGLVGIAHSEAEGQIVVFVEDEQTKKRVPYSFEGSPVRTEITGRIQVLSTQLVDPTITVSQDRQNEIRPLVGGTSVSPYVTDLYYAGTLGMVTYDDKILTNAHVLAMAPGTDEFLNTGIPIVQPGSADGGRLYNRVGELQSYIPIDFTSQAKNYADAAIGSIDEGVVVSPGEQFGEGGNYWIEGWAEVSKGDIVRKSGSATAVTTGKVINTNASLWVVYGDQAAYFVDQILVEQENWSFAAPDDSGSAVDKDGEFVGLVFAGSDTLVAINKAEYIVQELGIAVEPADGQYSLIVSSAPGGSVVIPGEGMFIYDDETMVSLVAEPDQHYRFVEWTGDVGTVVDTNAASTTITVSGSDSISAVFEPEEGWCSLTVSSIGGGTITVPGKKTFVYENGTVVDLVAESDEHYYFSSWVGDVATIGNPLDGTTNITMNDSYSIAAEFELEEGWCSLTVSSTKGGSVATPGEGISIHSTGTVVDLVAEPDEGYQFVKWTGDVSTIADVNAADTTIAMNSSYSVTASFKTLYSEPMALLTLSSSTGGSITTPDEVTSLHTLGSNVSLIAEPDEGYQFVNWSGNVDAIADVNDASTTITMDSSYSIRANFNGDSRCFIATAAYGTPMADEIQILRQFRDRYLLTNPVGKAFVDLYYRTSPPIARFITEYPNLKPMVRTILVPAVAMSTVAINIASPQNTAIALLFVLVLVGLVVWALRRRGRGRHYTLG
jgi:hypothetical protein